MVICQVSSRAKLAHKLIAFMITNITENVVVESFANALKCLVYLCQTQNLTELPVGCLKILSEFRYAKDFLICF